MKSILDPKFRYVPAARTDIRKTFARIRAARKEMERTSLPVNVQPLKEKKRG